MDTVLMVGTRKGLWIGQSDEAREDWEFTGPHFDMEEVYSCMIDTRGDRPRLLAGASSMWLGPRCGTPTTSARLGGDGQRRHPLPRRRRRRRRADLAAHPGRARRGVRRAPSPARSGSPPTAARDVRPRAGAVGPPAPAAVERGLRRPGLPHVLPHPTDPQSVTAAPRPGGVYQTNDGGASWEPRNQGIRAEFMPEGEQYPEFGQCVHKVTRHPGRPGGCSCRTTRASTLDDHGGLASIADGLPAEFGFPIVVCTTPTRSTSSRSTVATGATRPTPRPGYGARATRATRGRRSRQGAAGPFFVAVMRDAMCTDDHERAGSLLRGRSAVWGSADEGDTWRLLVSDLPDVWWSARPLSGCDRDPES